MMDAQKSDVIQAAYLIPGWMWPQEMRWLYDTFQNSQAHLEIGTFCGKSLFVTACGMARLQKNSSPLCVAVDPLGFSGLGSTWETCVLEATLQEIRRRGPLDLEWWSTDSVTAMRTAQKRGLRFDSIFIDGLHHYADVQRDIQGWLPFVRPGGVLAGHDYWPVHPGLMTAVREQFGDSVHLVPDTRIWWTRTPAEEPAPS